MFDEYSVKKSASFTKYFFCNRGHSFEKNSFEKNAFQVCSVIYHEKKDFIFQFLVEGSLALFV